MTRPIICVGDNTTHGGSVITGFSNFKLKGKAPAGVGHKVTCPKCRGVFPIVASGLTMKISGIEVAVQGMRTACGATLIAQQSSATVI